MRWYDYLLVVALSFFTSAGVLFMYERTKEPVKVIDVIKIMNAKIKSLDHENPEESYREMEVYLEELRKALQKEEGIVLIKNAVVGGRDYIDITDRFLTNRTKHAK